MPTIERPSVVLAQAPDDLATRTLNVVGQSADLLAGLELGSHRLDFLVDGGGARAAVILEFSRGKFLVGEFKGFGFLLLELLELLGYARLNLELD